MAQGFFVDFYTQGNIQDNPHPKKDIRVPTPWQCPSVREKTPTTDDDFDFGGWLGYSYTESTSSMYIVYTREKGG